MPRSLLALPLALAFVAACGGSGENVAVLDAGSPSATLDPSPAFTDGASTVDTVQPSDAVTVPQPPEPNPSTTISTDDEATANEAALSESVAPATDPAPVAAPESTAPPSTFLPAAQTFDLPGCPDTERGAVADKEAQRYWLCADGEAITDQIPMTTASGNYGLPPVGTYPVFARDENAFGIGGEALERFVAFYTTPRGNRIAFHEVVNQDPATVGDLDQRGASAGCFRVREDDSVQVWEFLQIDDPVVVIT